jgi:hypothetical protein
MRPSERSFLEDLLRGNPHVRWRRAAAVEVVVMAIDFMGGKKRQGSFRELHLFHNTLVHMTYMYQSYDKNKPARATRGVFSA